MTEKWTTEKIEELKMLYPIHGTLRTAELLGTTENRVRNKIDHLRKNSCKLTIMTDDKAQSKVCTICNELKPFERYYKSKAGRYGLHASCIDCWNKKELHRYQNDTDYHMIKILRKRYKIIFDSPYTKIHEHILGCSLTEFKQHIEKQFVAGMHWDNYGSGKNHWCFDHIIPIESLKEKPDGMHLIFNYRNYQPLWFEMNSAKGASLKSVKNFLNHKIELFGLDSFYTQMLNYLLTND